MGNSNEMEQARDLIDRQAAIDALTHKWDGMVTSVFDVINSLPSAQPERKKMSNKEWVDFLSEQFTVSRTSAREMFHGLMRWKAEDNFKKQFSGGKNEKE